MVESNGSLPQLRDYVNFSSDRELMSLIGQETLVYAAMIKKINNLEWSQERMFAITNLGVYNIHKKKVKRKIMVAEMGGLTKTVAPSRCSTEFTIHVPATYDYRFTTEKREEIVDVLKRVNFVLKQKNLPIFNVTSKDLREFTTTEKDMNKNQSRFPTPNYRTSDEDLYVEKGGAAASQSVVTPQDNGVFSGTTSGQADLAAQQAARGQQLTADSHLDRKGSESSDAESSEVRQSMAGGAAAVYARADMAPASLQDFQIRKMIGKGTFGKVYLVEHATTRKLYAMKCIRKDIILENEQMENIQLEKDILRQIDHPFLVNMEYVFQNDYRIYFLMKFVKGGELFRHLVEVRNFPENQSKFFAAQVALALAHLHSKGIIYRDLKPENVLVGEDGYLLVADFGLAKFVQQGELANSFCGTAEYLAPEMLIGNGHDFTVDWWALGILIFEMIVGIPPFFHRNKHRMYYLIRESPVSFPDPVRHRIEVSPQAQDLITKLLHKDRQNRLGANGVDEILAHPWFADLNLDALVAKQLTPPYVPQTKDDLAYFDKNLVAQTEVSDTILSASQRAVINKDKNAFAGFSQ